ncbi:MAG: PASTA domain-containing protein [Bacteroidetes bacterium]|nr:PASTA domain-containing protein [Bacteroidota bacterium]
MSFLQQIKERPILMNATIAVISFILLLVGINYFLLFYTHHDESLTVPDFKGMTLEEVQRICTERDLRFVIKDSVFSEEVPRLGVVEQNPKALSKVKKSRRIYLTLNVKKAPIIKLPDIINQTPTEAIPELQRLGFKINKEFEYKPDETNQLLGVKYKGKNILPGASLEKGSMITLVVGDMNSSAKVKVPKLVGKTLDIAMLILRGNDLNIGRISGDSSSNGKHNSGAIITKQNPEEDEMVAKGESIDIWLGKKKKKKDDE